MIRCYFENFFNFIFQMRNLLFFILYVSFFESNLYAQRSITNLDSLQIFNLIDSAEIFFDSENNL